MPDRIDPLIAEWLDAIDGLELIRQVPPAGSPSFAATYVGPAGWAYDPEGQEGVASVTNQLAISGAGSYDRIALARLLDRLGATLSRYCDPESGHLGIWGPSTEWDRLLDLLSEVVLRPRFDSEDLERVRRQMVERQLRELTQPSSRAERELMRAIYPPHHPYRESGIGRRESVSKLTRSQVARFQREHFTPEGGQLIVTASVPPSELRSAVARKFKGWTRRQAPGGLSAPRLAGSVHRTVQIPMRGRSQVEVRIGGDSIPRSSDVYPGAFLANEVLGSRPLLSRLFQRVRERHGLAYHASSDLTALRTGGYWTADAGTGGERWRRVVELVEKEIERLRRDPIPKSELETIRRSAIGEIPLSLETTAGAHQLAVEVAYYHLPSNFYRQWPRELKRLSAREVRAAAQVAFDSHRSATIVAGPLAGSG